MGKGGAASGTQRVDGKIMGTLIPRPVLNLLTETRVRQMEVNPGLLPDRAVVPRCVVVMGRAQMWHCNGAAQVRGDSGPT